MTKTRVYELARSRGLESKQVLKMLTSAGIPVRSAASTLTPEDLKAFDELVERQSPKEIVNDITSDSPTLEKSVRRRRRRVDQETTKEPDFSFHSSSLSTTETPNRQSDTTETQDLASRSDALTSKSEAKRYLRTLILQAYEAARESGKVDWQVMSIAVLKNRMTQLIGEPFDQKVYGYPRALDLALDFSDLLAVDETKSPPEALLLTTTPPTLLDENVKIRADLWRAILDYESGRSYYFIDGIAVHALEAPSGWESLKLPTIVSQDLDEWRRDFYPTAINILRGRPEAVSRLESWIERGAGTVALPGVLRGHWNLYLKSAVLRRLNDWSLSSGVPLPKDVTLEPDRSKRADLAKQASEENQLRRAIIEAVSRMSLEELKQVSLPSISLLRGRA